MNNTEGSLSDDRSKALKIARKRGNVGMSWIFIALGLGVIFAGFVMGVDRALFISASNSTDGRVVAVEEFDTGYSGRAASREMSSSQPVMYKRIVEYRVGEDTFRSTEESASGEKPKLGQVIRVYYSPENPNEALLDSGAEPWLGAVLVASGLAWLLLWGIVLLLSIRQGRAWEKIAIFGVHAPVAVGDLEKIEYRGDEGGRSRVWRIEFTGVDPRSGEPILFKETYGARKPRNHPPAGSMASVFFDPSDSKRYILVP